MGGEELGFFQNVAKQFQDGGIGMYPIAFMSVFALAILSDPETMRRMAASDAELAEGEGESEAALAAAMKQRRGSLDS